MGMKARDAVSHQRAKGLPCPTGMVDGGVHLLEVLPRLLEEPSRELGVTAEDGDCGVIDQASLLEALGRMIVPRYDCSVIEVECSASDYSASHLARAVEDSDVHLVDMITTPIDNNRLRVTLRVRCEDPSSTVHCLERYGYEVADVFGHENAGYTASMDRLLALHTLMNV